MLVAVRFESAYYNRVIQICTLLLNACPIVGMLCKHCFLYLCIYFYCTYSESYLNRLIHYNKYFKLLKLTFISVQARRTKIGQGGRSTLACVPKIPPPLPERFYPLVGMIFAPLWEYFFNFFLFISLG